MNLLTLSETERAIYKQAVNSTIVFLTNLYQSLTRKPGHESDNVNYCRKENGEWGYYISHNPFAIIYYMQQNNLKSIVDLGSGAGILLQILRGYGFSIKGFEIEDSLIKVATKLLGKNITHKKDILTLTEEDVKDSEVLYFWEPVAEDELAKKFVENLVNILSPTQTVLYYSSGAIARYLESSPKMKRVENVENLQVWKLNV